jgi:hypothetical protein
MTAKSSAAARAITALTASLAQAEAEVANLREALEPFAAMAGELFACNRNASDIALIAQIRLIASDPMWANHAEVSKAFLLTVANALAARPQAAEGMALVPREPTDQMFEAGWEAMFDDKYNGTQAVMMGAAWDAMIAAAPAGQTCNQPRLHPAETEAG